MRGRARVRLTAQSTSSRPFRRSVTASAARADSQQWHGKTEPLATRLDQLPIRPDAIICTHEFTDHCHQDTLTTGVSPDTPIVCGTAQTYKRVRGFEHFRSVIAAPYYREGTPTPTQFAPLPPELSFVYLPTRKLGDLARLHGALVVMWARGEGERRAAVVLSPHGVPPDVVEAWRRDEPEVEVLALLHSLDIVSNPWWLGAAVVPRASLTITGGVVALGHPSAVRLSKALKPRCARASPLE